LGLGPRRFHLLNLRNPENTTYPVRKKEITATPEKSVPIKKSEKEISFKR
jgi:hypothetical protein